MATLSQTGMLASVLIISVLAWAIHTRDRKGNAKYEINGKYEELSHVHHPKKTDELTKISCATPRAPFYDIKEQ